MSDFTSKDHKGLMEAYASIYQQPLQEEKVEEVEYQEYEIDTDAILESVKHYLVNFGYAEDEKKAEAMMPHLSEEWYDQVVTEIVVEQEFFGCINSILEEGYNLSSYTIDELYENYVGYFNESQQVDLHEVLPLVAAPVLANPATWAAGAALGAGALYAGKKMYDAARQLRGGTSKEGEAFLNQPLKAKKETPSQRKARVQANVQQRQQQQQTPAANPPKGKTTTVASPANKPQPMKAPEPPKPPGGGGGGGGGGGKPPEAPKPPKPPKGPFNWKDALLGTTRGGRITRGIAGTVAGSEVYGAATNPSSYSPTAGAAGLTLAPIGKGLEGLAGVERFGQRGPSGSLFGRGAYERGQRTTVGTAVRDAGETTSRVSQNLIQQPWRKPAQSTQPTQPAQPKKTRVKGIDY